jgi:hypothetical protein
VNAAESIGEWEGVEEESRTWVADIGDRADFVTGWLEMAAGCVRAGRYRIHRRRDDARDPPILGGLICPTLLPTG